MQETKFLAIIILDMHFLVLKQWDKLKKSLALRIFAAFLVFFLLSTLLTNVFAWYVLNDIIKRDQEVRFRLLESEIQSALREIYFDYTLRSIKGGSSSELQLLLRQEAAKRIQEIVDRVGGQFVIFKGKEVVTGKENFLNARGFICRKVVFNPLGWTVYLGVPQKIISQALKPLFFLYFGFLLLFISLGMCFSYLVYNRGIRRPICKVMRELEDSQERLRLSPTGIREIDRLVERVNQALEKERRLLQSLAFSEKMNALGTLAGGYAHEFNNLLQAVSGNLRLAQMWLERGNVKEARNRLEAAEKAALRGKQISDRILRLARKDLARREEFSEVSTAVRNTLEALRQGLPKGLRLEIQTEPGLFTSLTEDHIQEIVMNLCLNARDAMGEEGVLRVETRREGEKVLIVVEDSGPGIPEDIRSRIFEPFFTTKPPGRGTGLGLFVVHQLVTEAGGEIRVLDRSGGGTRFEILLPGCEPPPEKETVRESKPEGKLLRRRVLVVDDEAPIREGLREFLELEGLYAETAGSAEEALQKLREKTFDFLFVDLYMPEKDGIWLVKRAREEGWSGRIVLITGFAGELSEEARDLVRFGEVVEVLRKPFDLTAVRQIFLRGET